MNTALVRILIEMEAPATRYADVGGYSVAYQTYGNGPRDILMVPGILSHLDLLWTDPAMAHFMRRLAAFARVITYDRLGVGLSDSMPSFPTLDDRIAEIEAVLDAAESRESHVLALSEGGAYAAYFAATQPNRVTSISFLLPFVRGPRTDPAEGLDPSAMRRLAADSERWGEGLFLTVVAPDLAKRPMQRRLFARYERLVTSRGNIRAWLRDVNHLDVSAILSQIRVPCLVVGVTGDPFIPIEHVRAIAAAIPDARLEEIEGRDHLIWGEQTKTALDTIERFVTGALTRANVDRVLATVVFTDIVGSTQRLAELGDREWRSLLEAHDERVRRVLEQHDGHEVKTLGDGFLMTFPAPHSALTAVRALQKELTDIDLEIRAGIHTGEVEIVGSDLTGMSVNIAARISALAGPGEILVSQTVRDLLKPSGTACQEWGTRDLKGVPGAHVLYAADVAARQPIDGDRRNTRVLDRLSLAVARRTPRIAQAINARLQGLAKTPV